MQCNLCFWFSRIRNKFIKIQMHTSHLSFFITKKYWSAHLVSSFLNWYPSIYSSMAKLHDVCLKVLFSKEVILMAIGTHINEVNEQLFFHSHYKKNFYRHLTECKCNFFAHRIPRCDLLTQTESRWRCVYLSLSIKSW